MTEPQAYANPILVRITSQIRDTQNLLHAIYAAQASLVSSYEIEWDEDGEIDCSSADQRSAIDTWYQLDLAASSLRSAQARLIEAQNHIL